MNYKTFILVFALAVTAIGQEDPNCEPYEIIEPPWSDPNGFGNGIILPAQFDPNGVADFNAPCGKFVRHGAYCDKQAPPVVADVNTPGWGVTLDPAAGTWRLTGDVLPGPNYVVIVVTDVPLYSDPVEKIYCVWIWGVKPENTGPVFR